MLYQMSTLSFSTAIFYAVMLSLSYLPLKFDRLIDSPFMSIVVNGLAALSSELSISLIASATSFQQVSIAIVLDGISAEL